jgi:hypothetical protein
MNYIKRTLYTPPPIRSHPTVRERISLEGLDNYGIEYTEDLNKADVIVFSIFDEFISSISDIPQSAKLLLWCDEPIWSNLYTVFDRNYFSINTKILKKTLSVMNCFTGSVHLTNFHFLRDEFFLGSQTLSVQIFNENSFHFDKQRASKAICFMTYRLDPRWSYKHFSGIRGISNLRTEFVLTGMRRGFVDVYGQGFTTSSVDEMATESFSNPYLEKLSIQKQYRFAICFENTVAPFYVTEKIWHAILSGCLPIYYAGDTHTIYQDFPRNSFIDVCDFTSFDCVYDFCENIPVREYERRLDECRDVLLRAISTNAGGLAERMQIQSLRNRIDSFY